MRESGHDYNSWELGARPVVPNHGTSLPGELGWNGVDAMNRARVLHHLAHDFLLRITTGNEVTVGAYVSALQGLRHLFLVGVE